MWPRTTSIFCGWRNICVRRWGNRTGGAGMARCLRQMSAAAPGGAAGSCGHPVFRRCAGSVKVPAIEWYPAGGPVSDTVHLELSEVQRVRASPPVAAGKEYLCTYRPARMFAEGQPQTDHARSISNARSQRLQVSDLFLQSHPSVRQDPPKPTGRACCVEQPR